MLAKSSNLIDEFLLEARVKVAASEEQLLATLKNLWKRDFSGEFPLIERKFKRAIFIKIAINEENKDNPFPGLHYKPGIDQHYSSSILNDKYLKPLGWTVTSIEHYNHNLRVVLSHSSRTQKTVEKPRYLYHIAPRRYENKILKQGLKPKDAKYDSLYRNHEPQIYFFTIKPDIDHAEEVDLYGEVTVFRVDTLKFDRFNIYNDSSVVGDIAVYTRTHIPPSAIDIIDRFNA